MGTSLDPKGIHLRKIPQLGSPALTLDSQWTEFIHYHENITRKKALSLFGSMELEEKWESFLEATENASSELDRLDWGERAHKQLWLYNKGQFRGIFQGLLEGISLLLSTKGKIGPKSDSLWEFSKALPLYEEIVLDFGTEYMEADWEKKGELAGKATVKTGLWILNLRKSLKNFTKLLKDTLDRFENYLKRDI